MNIRLHGKSDYTVVFLGPASQRVEFTLASKNRREAMREAYKRLRGVLEKEGTRPEPVGWSVQLSSSGKVFVRTYGERHWRTAEAPLSEEEWARVFDLRCRSKRGEHIAPDDTRLFRRALASDRARYCGMDEEIRVATAPFGSRLQVRRKDSP